MAVQQKYNEPNTRFILFCNKKVELENVSPVQLV